MRRLFAILCVVAVAACASESTDPPVMVDAGLQPDATADAPAEVADAGADGDADAADAYEPPPCTCTIKQCSDATCDAGACVYEPEPDGTPCAGGGTCKSGICDTSAEGSDGGPGP